MIETAYTKIAVLGAAGKMGRGIALLLLQEMSLAELSDKRGRFLLCFDTSSDALATLVPYFRTQLVKYAEKKINALRLACASHKDCIDNADHVELYVETAIELLRFATDTAACKGVHLVFEAIVENIDVKCALFQDIAQKAPQALFLTNTSSIPIGELDAKAKLNGRIIGFHFYNPPPIQKLVEVIATPKTVAPLKELSVTLGKMLEKTLISSGDVAGFIGNGQFMRDISFACTKVKENVSIVTLEIVSRDLLLRPMGIFQLVDYVGVDVCLKIFAVMEKYIPTERFEHSILDRFAKAGIFGGQNPDGSQKNGIFKYEKGPVAVYNIEKGVYEPLSQQNAAKITWKALSKKKDCSKELKEHFSTLQDPLAKEYLQAMRVIGQKLIDDGIAKTKDDLNNIMKMGFAHLYGPLYEA